MQDFVQTISMKYGSFPFVVGIEAIQDKGYTKSPVNQLSRKNEQYQSTI